ncbi:MAG TPA: hypothetical protein VJR02_21500 [Pyrinomonadaceae bacterium]|nr:hypothetical protein [Pyrinomonadaceae bacterium]
MVKFIILSLVIFGIPPSSHAGDCFTHPVVIHELVVDSCEILSDKNAASISQVARPSVIASRYHGAILTGQERRRRNIEVDNLALPNPTPMAWEKIGKPIKLLFVSEDRNVCSRFPNGKKTAVAYYTNCECDTGPHGDGYCALTVLQVNEVPKKFEKYAR